MSEAIKVSMLGKMAIEYNGQRIDDSLNRMKKVWLILAYLIYNRNAVCTQEHFFSLLRGASSEEIEDAAGRLKAMFYRARGMLDQLEDKLGHQLIVRRSGRYAWNNDVMLTLDVDEFENLCAQADVRNSEEQIEIYRKALQLYQGDFLPKLSMEPWVMPLSAYYHQLYVNTVEKMLTLLIDRRLWEESAQLCQQALRVEPYNEVFYQQLMRCRIAMDDRSGAVAAYDEMSNLLFSNFGVMPSEESRALYREAMQEKNKSAVPISAVREQLQDTEPPKGAMLCEFDFFKFLYTLQARAIVRTGEIIHILLFSVYGEDRQPLARRSLDRAMENLTETVVGNLRQSDVVTRYSVSQLLVMLPQANYENSCAVCRRVIQAFNRKYPHSPANIHFSVQPLEPIFPK